MHTTKTNPAKLMFPLHGFIMNRRKLMKENRQPREKELLLKYLGTYQETAIRLHRLGFICYSNVANTESGLRRHETDYRYGEQRELFEAQQKESQRLKRLAKKASSHGK